MSPLLVGVLRGWVEGKLPADNSAAARVSAFLLGEIGSTDALPALFQLMLVDSEDIHPAVTWAFYRMCLNHPRNAEAALREFLGVATPDERQALAEFVPALPQDNPVRALEADLPPPGDPVKPSTMRMVLPVSVYDACAAGNKSAEAGDIPINGPPYKPGRNDPCWCGSGKKYKKCHLPDDERGVPAAPPPSVSDADAALRPDIIEFIGKTLSQEEIRRASDRYFGPAIPGDEGELIGLFEWLMHDYVSPKLGRTIVEEYAARNRYRLSSAERTAFANWAVTPMSLYEVVDVRPGEGLTLEDILRGGRYDVHDVTGSRNTARWDILLTRVVKAVSGRDEMSGAGTRIPASGRERLEQWVRSEHRKTGLSWTEFLRGHAHRIRQRACIDARRSLENLKLVTGDGEAVFSKAYWEVSDSDAAQRVLSGSPRFEEDDGGFVWLDERDKTKPLGSIRMKGTELVLETLSRERLERGKQIIESAAGECLRHARDEFKSPQDVSLEDLPKQPSESGREIPDAVQRQIVTEMLERHYSGWPDEALPALGGQTPREAVRTSEGRARVEQLLKKLENSQERNRQAGDAWYNLNKIRRQLELSTPPQR
jgi:hypothetical protein